LLICAKHLFVAAIGGSSTRHWEARQQAQPQARGSEHFPVAAANYARKHPEVLVVVVQSAASDWAAARLAAAIEHVALALAEPEEVQRILPAGESLVRVRP
jgi:hypothetical protein